MLDKIIKLAYKRFKIAMTWPAVTVEYPAVYRKPPHGSRVTIRNEFSECVGCHDCEQKCPVDCIKIVSEAYTNSEKAPKTSKGVVFEKKVTSFVIDYNECINCGICIDICPTQALSFEKNFVVPRQKNQLLKIDLVHRPRSVRIEQGFED